MTQPAHLTRWIVLKTPWWECIAAAIPFLVDWHKAEVFQLIEPANYVAPGPFERHVILAPHRAPELAPLFEQHADRVVLYETENLLGAPDWRARSAAIRQAAPSVKWLNYSRANSAVFGDTFHPLRRLLSAPAPGRYRDPAWGGPDVLFVGSMNGRRAAVLDKLRDAGVRVLVPDRPVFGAELAYLESYSRLLLNIHYYTPGVFESFRVVPAIHRGTAVLSEISEGGEGSDWCECVRYETLVDATLAYLAATRKPSEHGSRT